jgi:glycosyltransferase involved in cell wall biosynthesis
MSTEPLVSVIVRAFGSRATLPGGVRSLLAQTYRYRHAMTRLDEEPARAA